MARNKAPVQLTGGAGFYFEDHVAARLLLDLLMGNAPLGEGPGRIKRLHWQAHDLEWLADDLVADFTSTSGDAQAGLSIKENRQITRRGFPRHFVEAIWRHQLGLGNARRFGERDAVALAVGKLASTVMDAWQKLLNEALATTEERLLARLTPKRRRGGSQSSKLERDLFASLRCPESLVDEDVPDDRAVVHILRRVRVLHFDFGTETSADQQRAIRDAQGVLRSGDREEAAALWHRLLAISADRRSKGGALDHPGLIAELRGTFQLLEHPDYRADWKRLEALSIEESGDVHTSIADLPALDRTKALETVAAALAKTGACVIAGQSGVGKSALAKSLGALKYDRLVWIPPELASRGSHDQFMSELGIGHPLGDVLVSGVGTALVVFDGAEHLTAAGRLAVARLARKLNAGDARHIHVLLTTGLEATSLARASFEEAGAGPLQREELTTPAEAEVRALVRGVAGLRWASLRAELKPMLRNLKVLEWVVDAVRGGAVLDPTEIVNISGLIDHLWSRWIEGNDQRTDLSALMMQLAIADAEQLASGVARTRLGHEEQDALKALVNRQLVRLRRERVSFTHDMVGDWARLRVLMAEVPESLSKLSSRARRIRWHRAIRLYGQHVIDTQGPATWLELIGQVDDGTYPGTIARDLLLEAACLASNSKDVLETVWPKLIADECRLLRLMLARFLYVGTTPAQELLAARAGEADHRVRIPLTPYWEGVLSVLHAHKSEVAQLLPVLAARVAGMWLRWTQPLALKGAVLWRKEAAELAVEVARRAQIEAEVNDEHLTDWEPVFQALLYASHDLPADVVALCRQLSHRAPLPQPIVEMREQRRREAEERRRQSELDNPEKAALFRKLTTSPIPRGPMRQPWPDGPSRRIAESFRAACLDAGAFAALAATDAAAACEILLAVCIEPPTHEDPYNARHDDLGLEYWKAGYPPMYFWGPFLRFLRDAPNEALTFVIRLVNFATHRWAEQSRLIASQRVGGEGDGLPGVPKPAVGVDAIGAPVWIGDDTVFRWTSQSSHGNGALSCSLMALEKWLYDEVDCGNDVGQVLRRVQDEGASIAFAAILVNLAKRHPQLLLGPLRPVLATWQLHVLDGYGVASPSSWQMSWGGQPELLVEYARDWFEMPHRRVRLESVAIGLLLSTTEASELVSRAREKWREAFAQDAPPELERLIACLDPTNYAMSESGVTFRWPKEIEQRRQRELPAHERDMEVMVMPMRCRRWLSGDEPLPPDAAERLWAIAEELALQVNPSDRDNVFPFLGPRDAFYGAVAVLLTLQRGWLGEEERRLERCKAWLLQALDAPAGHNRFAEHMVTSEVRFDAFVAEAGVLLLAEDRTDEGLRRLVAQTVTSEAGNITRFAMNRAFRKRVALREDFNRLQHLATEWAAVRGLARQASYYRLELPSLEPRRRALIDAFVHGATRTDAVSILDADHRASELMVEIDAKLQEAKNSGANRAPWMTFPPEAARQPISFDADALTAAFGWVDFRAPHSAAEHAAWLQVIKQCLQLALRRLDRRSDREARRSAPLPDDFDHWILSQVARALPHVGPQEAEELWQPVMALAAKADHWVETFLGHWFVDGSRSATSTEDFASVWECLLRFALDAEAWAPSTCRDAATEGVVGALFGFRWGGRLPSEEGFSQTLRLVMPHLDRAAARWLGLPRVAQRFANLARQPGARPLLLPALAWLRAAVERYDDDAWSSADEIDDALVRYLRKLWLEERTRVVSDDSCRQDFEHFLTVLTARGSYAAQALRDELLAEQ